MAGVCVSAWNAKRREVRSAVLPNSPGVEARRITSILSALTSKQRLTRDASSAAMAGLFDDGSSSPPMAAASDRPPDHPQQLVVGTHRTASVGVWRSPSRLTSRHTLGPNDHRPCGPPRSRLTIREADGNGSPVQLFGHNGRSCGGAMFRSPHDVVSTRSNDSRRFGVDRRRDERQTRPGRPLRPPRRTPRGDRR